MRICSLLASILFTLLVVLPGPSLPCTTFCFQNQGAWVFGRNLDWMVEAGLVVVNKRDVAKISFDTSNPFHWTSRHGSVTFNQYGREVPMGGMNEAGLVLECMWLNVSQYPQVDSRPGLDSSQWIQYQLDSAATVDEVIASDAMVRIMDRSSATLHFLVCDSQGSSATIEFLGGEMVVHRGSDLPFTALTNNTYDQALAFVETCGGDESQPVFQDGSYSRKRFFWASRGVLAYTDSDHTSPVDYAFALLEKVSVNRTQWRVVYDVGGRGIYFRTKSEPAIRFIDFDAFDFSCETPVLILDMAAPCQGNVTADFVPYTYEANLDLISTSYRQTDFLQHISPENQRWLARFPETLECTEDGNPPASP